MLKFILIFVVVFLVVRLIQSFTRPVSRGYSSTNGYNSRKKEGEVTIDKKNANTDKRFSKKDGEYVDYEEV